jgi:hypothetical protein
MLDESLVPVFFCVVWLIIEFVLFQTNSVAFASLTLSVNAALKLVVALVVLVPLLGAVRVTVGGVVSAPPPEPVYSYGPMSQALPCGLVTPSLSVVKYEESEVPVLISEEAVERR